MSDDAWLQSVASKFMSMEAIELDVSEETATLAGSMLDRRDEVDARDADGFAPLHRAAAAGDLAQLQALLARGADVRARSAHADALGGLTALHCAVASGDARTVRALIAAGASVEARDATGVTPLVLAAQLGDYEIVKAILVARADPRVFVGDTDATQTAARAGHARVHGLLAQVSRARSR
jgi:ankyrin repeat protein